MPAGKRLYPTVNVTLSCNHVTEMPLPVPTFGDTLYCTVCEAGRTVVEVPDRWETKCTKRKGCYHTLAATEATAKRRADAHIKRFRHEMEIRHGGLAVHKWEPLEGWYQPWHPSIKGVK